MGILSELPFRAPAYLWGVGEFAGNLWRNACAKLAGEAEGPSFDLTGKSCVITGGTAGIGLATAGELAARGCKVYLACRSVDKGLTAAKAIREANERRGSPSGPVEVLQLELGSLVSARRFCEGFACRGERLDILILNAGIMGNDFKRRTTADGLEEHFQVNHLSQWLVAHRLVSERLRRRQEGSDVPPIRVIFLTSFLHMAGDLHFDDLQLTRTGYSGFRAYSNSKLANCLSARRLQASFDGQHGFGADAAVAVHPGLIRTDLADGWLSGEDLFGGLVQAASACLLKILSPLILEPPSRAARTVLYAATAPAAEVKGRYVAYGRTTQPARVAEDAAAAQQLWEASLQICKEPPSILEELGS